MIEQSFLKEIISTNLGEHTLPYHVTNVAIHRKQTRDVTFVHRIASLTYLQALPLGEVFTM